MSLLVEFPGRSFWMIRYTFGLCFVYLRRYSFLDHLLQHFHLQHTHGTLSLTPSLLFTRPQTNQRPRPRPKAQYIILGPYPYYIYIYIYIYILDDEALICILKHRIPNLVDHFNFISWGWFQIISHTFRSLELSHALKNVLIQASHKLYMTLMENAKTKWHCCIAWNERFFFFFWEKEWKSLYTL